MKITTRFNPTPTGKLHVGHLYMALVNAVEAHLDGGTFIVRIDDTQDYWLYETGEKETRRLGEEYIEQIGLFTTIDRYEFQSKMPSIRRIMGDNKLLDEIPKQKWGYESICDWIGDPRMLMYPCAPPLTLEKVVWDFYDGIFWLIRGEDLLTEACLYNWFCIALELPIIRQTYLPRLRAGNRDQLGSTYLSKTFKNYRLQDQIDKFGVDGTLYYLRQSCLIDPDDDFIVRNIKWNPIVVGFES